MSARDAVVPLGGVVRDTLDDECVVTDSCKRRTATHCTSATARQQSLCNRPHGWKERDPSCRRSPRSQLEVCHAQNELKVLASGSANEMGSGCIWAAATAEIAARQARALGTNCEPAAPATAIEQRAITSPEPRSHTKSSRARSARKAPSTQKRCRARQRDRRRRSAPALEERRHPQQHGLQTRS